MSDQLEKLLALEPMKKPAKAWRNWWEATDPFTHAIDGRHFKSGEVVQGHKIYPSKDAAQTAAPFTQSMNIRRFGACLIRYVGAFPEGERP